MTEAREACRLEIRRLAEWAASTAANAIPHNVLARGVLVIADDLAAMIGARNEPEVVQWHAKVLAQEQPPESTVFRGGRSRTNRISAAIANGVAADWLELDEGYRPTSCHAGLYVLPALLAEAEAGNLAFEEMLRSLVLGYEIVTRVARAWSPASNMQPHGRYSAVGAAAGIALARSHNAARLVAALGTAATLAGAGPRIHLAEGTLARNVWPAAGAWSGMMAVEWAECGIEGAATAFHDVYTTAFGGTMRAGLLTGALGSQWAILDGYTKIYACCQHLHSAVEAALALRPELLRQGGCESIDSIRVDTHSLALPLADAHPTTSLGGKFSMPHAIAAVLATGAAGAQTFSASNLHSPEINRLRERTVVAAWTPELPPPNDRPARVAITLRNGSTIQRECLSAAGGPDRPLPPQTVLEKLGELAEPVYPAIRPLFEELAGLPSPRMRQGWRQIVDEICA